MKIIALVACLLLAGCGAARDFGALLYCVAHDGDINRKCQ